MDTGGELQDDKKVTQQGVRAANIQQGRAVADTVRTSLGPRGMDKMVQLGNGEVIITNDGATIMKHLQVEHPAAKMLVDLSKSQDVVAGDGTTTVVVLAGALLGACSKLLNRGIHPSQISDAFQIAANHCEEVLKGMSVPVDFTDKTEFIKAATTALNSKVVSQNSGLLAPMAVDAVMAVGDTSADTVDLKNIKVVKKLGGTVDDTELIPGLVFEQKASKQGGLPTRMVNAKIAVVQYQLSPPKTDLENTVIVSDYQQMDRILREERNYVGNLVKSLRAAGVNVLLLQKSILRDAITDLGLHFLARAKIMLVRDVEREDIEFICKTLHCVPIASPDGLKPEKLGKADLVEEFETPGGKIVKITGVPKPCPTMSILCRGSNKLMLEENERSIHDALCVVRSLYKMRLLIAGGSAPEMELQYRLSELAKTLPGTQGPCVRGFADAFEVIPYTLAENAGLHPISIVSELRARHARGEKNAGLNVRKGTITDILEENVVQPTLVDVSAVTLATECVRMILKIDDIVQCGGDIERRHADVIWLKNTLTKATLGRRSDWRLDSAAPHDLASPPRVEGRHGILESKRRPHVWPKLAFRHPLVELRHAFLSDGGVVLRGDDHGTSEDLQPFHHDEVCGQHVCIGSTTLALSFGDVGRCGPANNQIAGPELDTAQRLERDGSAHTVVNYIDAFAVGELLDIVPKSPHTRLSVQRRTVENLICALPLDFL
eukprot:CAMPEP_0175923552 /NCGR_PEP_ID=MMETSP0108-20121206/14632_1 /TAXON_ID=195067 ORGANISM="Goniomonas pacifica, Strain CCMP1869" /NCGR_SAMPLE_ID=MMETSP0108 /ASSEMBLY_ACC=CAM_ASM_000204 /LENGTH=719 /DNA_ID=CAMNT_0017246561 /DNA_START=6 /DNA_END=2166 /DNA_ORIENTATION=-